MNKLPIKIYLYGMVELKVRFGKNLKRIRSSSGITQEKLADKLDVTPEFISLIERGLRAPSFETIEEISKVLGVKIADLFRQRD
jgi:transcriptional regulator with XRE-family HTH domain